VFECPASQGVKERYNVLFADHAATIVHFMQQHDTRAVGSTTSSK